MLKQRQEHAPAHQEAKPFANGAPPVGQGSTRNWNRLDTPEAALLRFASRNYMLDMLDVYPYTHTSHLSIYRIYTHARRVIRAKICCCRRSRHEGPAYAR